MLRPVLFRGAPSPLHVPPSGSRQTAPPTLVRRVIGRLASALPSELLVRSAQRSVHKVETNGWSCTRGLPPAQLVLYLRSEERRVGKEGRVWVSMVIYR